MTYDELIAKLKPHELFPSKVIQVEKQGEDRIIALHIDAPPFQRHKKEVIIKEICGDDFFVQWVGNNCNWFFVSKKK